MGPDTLPEDEVQQGGVEHEKIPGGLRPDETAKLDQMEAGLKDQSSSGSGIGAGPSGGSGFSQFGKQIARFATKNKKPLMGGGAGAGVLALVIGGFSLLGPLELLHIFNNEYQHAFQSINRWEQKESNKVMDKILKKAAERRANNGKDPATSDEPLQDEVNKVDMEALDNELKSEGITAEYDAKGSITKIEADGKTLDENQLASDTVLEADPNLADNIAKAAPELDVGHLTDYRPLMDFHEGVSFKFWGDTPTDDVTKEMADKVSNGAAEDEQVQAAGEASDQTPDPKAQDPGQQAINDQNHSAGEAADGPLKDALNATETEFQASGSQTSALQKGVDAFTSESAGKAVFVAGIASMLCSAKKDIVKVANERTLTYIRLLMRHGNLLLTMASQMKEGKLNGKDFNDTMKTFQGNPDLKPLKDGTPQEGSLPFDKSAAWQRATGHKVTGPELSKAANPNKDSTKDLIDGINADINKVPGADLSCSALTSRAGGLIQGVLGLGQLILSIPSFGTDDAVVLAMNIGIVETFSRVLLPDILKTLTNISITGTENAVQWFNNSDAGLSLSKNDYARRLGGRPTTNAETAKLALATEQDLAAQHARKPIAQQLFATSDEHSALSQLVMKMPLSFSSALSQFNELPHSILATMLPAARADDQINPYNFTNYDFTDNELGSNDPYANEDFIRKTTVSLPVGPKTYAPFKIVDVLGDPTAYQDSHAGDPNNDKCDNSNSCHYDLLHCFVNPTDSFYDLNTGGPKDPDCGSYGLLLPEDTSNPDANAASQPNLVDIACHYQVDRNQWPKTPCAPVFPSDTLQRYRQYMLDWHIAHNFVRLTTAQ